MSSVELLNCAFELYGNKKNSQIILSKGHAAAALYATLFIKKIINEKPSKNYGLKGSLLLGHPNNKISAIPYATGSLGHGIGYGAGWALGQRLIGSEGISIVIGGDGELQEGSVWEALQVISSKKINNIMYFIDKNNAQNDGYISQISPYYDLKSRFKSFGFQIFDIDGHDIDQIYDTYQKKSKKSATIVIANTIKAKGIKVMENNPKSHYAKLDINQKERWKKQLRFNYEKSIIN